MESVKELIHGKMAQDDQINYQMRNQINTVEKIEGINLIREKVHYFIKISRIGKI